MLLEEHDVEDIDKLLLEQLEDREVSEELQLDDKDDGELLETLLLEETKENETLDEEEEGEENIWLLEQELIALLELVSLPNVTLDELLEGELPLWLLQLTELDWWREELQLEKEEERRDELEE